MEKKMETIILDYNIISHIISYCLSLFYIIEYTHTHIYIYIYTYIYIYIYASVRISSLLTRSRSRVIYALRCCFVHGNAKSLCICKQRRV